MSWRPEGHDSASRVESEWRVGGANRARWRADGVLQVDLGDERHGAGAIYEEQDGHAALNLVTELIGTKKRVRLLVDIRALRRTSAGVRRIPAHPEAECLAFWVAGPVSRMLGNAYLGIVKPTHPTRLFTDKREALAWLNSPRFKGESVRP